MNARLPRPPRCQIFRFRSSRSTQPAHSSTSTPFRPTGSMSFAQTTPASPTTARGRRQYGELRHPLRQRAGLSASPCSSACMPRTRRRRRLPRTPTRSAIRLTIPSARTPFGRAIEVALRAGQRQPIRLRASDVCLRRSVVLCQRCLGLSRRSAANPATGRPANSQRYFRSRELCGVRPARLEGDAELHLQCGPALGGVHASGNKGSMINYPVLGPPGMELSGMKLFPQTISGTPSTRTWGRRSASPTRLRCSTTRWWCAAAMLSRTTISTSALFNIALEDGPGIANFGLCCGGTATPPESNTSLGRSNSAASYPPNPALKTTLNPMAFDGCCVEVYGAARNISILRAICSRSKCSASWERP